MPAQAFDWRKYLELAQAVQGEKTASEAQQRTAVSRAYYAVYNLAEAKWGAFCQRGGADSYHKKLWQSLARMDDDETAQKVSERGSALLAKRKKADYEAKIGAHEKWSRILEYAIDDAEEAV